LPLVAAAPFAPFALSVPHILTEVLVRGTGFVNGREVVNGKQEVNCTTVERVQDARKLWKVGGPMSLKYFSSQHVVQ